MKIGSISDVDFEDVKIQYPAFSKYEVEVEDNGNVVEELRSGELKRVPWYRCTFSFTNKFLSIISITFTFLLGFILGYLL